MFRDQVLPPTLSLFSSTGNKPLGLWRTQTDVGLPKDSHITLRSDSGTSSGDDEIEEEDQGLDYLRLEEDEALSNTISHPVLHIQSPTLASTYIHSPAATNEELGIKLPWIHLQVRNLRKEWSFEVGVRDRSGRKGIIRCSTFQKEAELIPNTPAILLLPLKFSPPPSSKAFSSALTSWSTISIDLGALSSHFVSSSLIRHSTDSEQVKSGTYPIRFDSGTYVRVYANCRLRRLWFTEIKERGGVRTAWELELYG